MRGGEWYPENSGSRKILFQSRNLGGVFNKSRNLVFLCFFASRILQFLAARSRSLGFCFLTLLNLRSALWLTDFETLAGIKTDPILNNYLIQTMENNRDFEI